MTTIDDAYNRPVLTVSQTAELLGLGRNAAYDAVARGDIPSIRIGRRLLVPKAALENLLTNLQWRSRDDE